MRAAQGQGCPVQSSSCRPDPHIQLRPLTPYMYPYHHAGPIHPPDPHAPSVFIPRIGVSAILPGELDTVTCILPPPDLCPVSASQPSCPVSWTP